ncbi:MAG TPA: UvrD-helicase domain-containing protein [Vicinamibacterales bacterium]|nr:UvrD-helicase domain-containing protein [Vicinamibacterales bacterium]
MSGTSDASARAHAVDPSRNVVLEASAGTGKTRVLVERYVNLLRAGVEPDHILAITFTRKAAAEMRERIIERLREAARLGQFDAGRWRELKERLGEIAISTIDAFCLSLLREFPLEADVDPGFDLADDTEVPRLIGESLDRALRICRGIARDNDDVALVFAQLGERRLRTGLAALLDRRLVAPQALRRYLSSGPRDLTAAVVCQRSADRLRGAFAGVRGGVDAFLDDGPTGHPAFAMLADDVRRLCANLSATGASTAGSGPSVVGSGPSVVGSGSSVVGSGSSVVGSGSSVVGSGSSVVGSGSSVVGSGFSRTFARRDEQAEFRTLADRLRTYFVKADGEPRGGTFTGTGFNAEQCASPAAWKRHRTAAASIAPAVTDALKAFRRDLNVVLSRGVWTVFRVTLDQYQRTLDGRALLDFSGVLERAVKLLKDMDEFAQSRYRLESRYRHVLVDEFQDTSRAQWQLVSQLVRNWGEGLGAAADAIQPSIFIVGDRKQSIYGFRDADVSVLDEAAAFVSGLRDRDDPRRAISVSFRSKPQILAFVNDLFGAIDKAADRPDRFRYEESDRFPIQGQVRLKPDPTTDRPDPTRDTPHPASDTLDPTTDRPDPTTDGPDPTTDGPGPAPALADAGQATLPWDDADDDADQLPVSAASAPSEPALGIVVGDTITAAAERVGAEIASLIGHATVRDRVTGTSRPAQAADIAILFRSRDTHREFEKALERHGVSTYVYKGLGFFESDEVQDAVSLLRFLADPQSNIRAAAFIRSRIVRLSDAGLAALAPDLASALIDDDPLAAMSALSIEDRRVLDAVRAAMPRWLSWVDRLAPAELLSRLLSETAHACELRGARHRQARENLKKLRAMVRRHQNRGYATLERVSAHIERLAVGDESNAAIDAHDAVSLMTVHASKGLEYPIVFVVNMHRGTGNARAPIRVAADVKGEPSVAIADYQSEADDDAVPRDREETKRLLYVALTRARDRLYLSGVVGAAGFRPTRGALGEVLPASVRELFVRASTGIDRTVIWDGADDVVHSLAVAAS